MEITYMLIWIILLMPAFPLMKSIMYFHSRIGTILEARSKIRKLNTVKFQSRLNNGLFINSWIHFMFIIGLVILAQPIFIIPIFIIINLTTIGILRQYSMLVEWITKFNERKLRKWRVMFVFAMAGTVFLILWGGHLPHPSTDPEWPVTFFTIDMLILSTVTFFLTAKNNADMGLLIANIDDRLLKESYRWLNKSIRVFGLHTPIYIITMITYISVGEVLIIAIMAILSFLHMIINTITMYYIHCEYTIPYRSCRTFYTEYIAQWQINEWLDNKKRKRIRKIKDMLDLGGSVK